MSQASIDQFAVAHGLEKAGFNARQAKAMVRAMNIISGSNEQIASDVAQLRAEVVGLPELKQDVAQLKQDVAQLKQDVAQLKQDVACLPELKQDVAQLKNDVKNLVTREEFERTLRRLSVRLYAAVGAGYAFTVGTIFAMLRFMLP